MNETIAFIIAVVVTAFCVAVLIWILRSQRRLRQQSKDNAVLAQLFKDSAEALARGDVNRFNELEAAHRRKSDEMCAKYGYKV